MKILFLSDNFPPEVNAPATRTWEHCREWVRRGADVTVITCFPNFPEGKVFPGYRNRWRATEVIDGIRVIRVWSYMVPNKGFLKRTLDYISFSVTGFLAGLGEKPDVIVATSPQFFTALAGRMLHIFKRRPWVMEVRDLWPESIKTVGAMKDNLFIRYFERKEMQCYKSAARIVVVTDSFKERLVERGVPGGKISVVKNGVDADLFTPRPKDMELVRELGLEGKKVIGYIGTHGMAHKLDFILRCARNLEDRPYHFLLIGGGAEKENLLALREELGCTNVTMLDPVPKSEVARYISILDVSLINLRRSPLFKTVIPSKIFENAGMGIPILLGVDGEARRIVESYGAGLAFEPENEADFRMKLDELLDRDCYLCCRKGCAALAADFDRKKLAAGMLDILEAVPSAEKNR